MGSRNCIVIALMAGLAVTMASGAESVGDRLHKGIYQEETVGDLEAAMKIYQEILADAKANRPHAAQAKYRLGMCHVKKGETEKAVATFEGLINDFPGQANLLEQARGQLAALGHAPESEEPAGVELQEVWSFSGLDNLNVKSISCDGRYCAFIHSETGDLMVRDLTSGEDRRLTEPAAGRFVGSTSISPDNKWVAYVEWNGREWYELRIVGIDGSGERTLYVNEEKSKEIYLRGWDPESQHLLATFCDTGGDVPISGPKAYRIVMVSVADGSIKVLKKVTERNVGYRTPRFSPDGRYVAYDRAVDGQRDVFLVPLDGGEEIHLIDHPARDSVLGWIPDSQYFLFTSDRGGNGLRAWMIHVVDGKPEGVARQVSKHVVSPRWTVAPDPVRTPAGGWAFYYRESWSQRKGRIRMMQITVSGELAKEMCTANLTKVGKAIEQYKNDHGDVPNWLSDLYPDYLQDTHLLLCPADHSGGSAGAIGFLTRWLKDPETPCSYGYMFCPGGKWVYELMAAAALPVDLPAREGMTWRDARKLQLEYFGPVVPIVQCRHHSPRIFLAYDGDIYEAERGWELSPRAGAGLLSQLKAAMKTEPGTWVQRYDTQRFLLLLRLAAGDEAALAKLLETHLKEHPDDEAAREFLAELPGLRSCRDGSLEEVDDGSVELGPIDLELGEKVVGIWFPDIPVPQGVRVKRAYVQFTAQLERPASEKTDLVLHAELAPNADSCKKAKHNITSRRKTAASVKWSPEPWTVPNERSQRQRTPDLSSLIQEVVNQPDWQKGNALVLVISGSGRRRAQPHEDWSGAPMLYVEH